MKRVKIIASYDGSHFSGYQVQPDARTVQGELQKALARMHKADSWNATGSGRTDTGVHSLGQTIHFDTSLNLPENRWPMALNALLPDDIIILEASYVGDDFHARYDTVGKEYIYRVETSKVKNVFKRNYCFHVREELDLEKMQKAASHYLGTHDFTSFSSPRTAVVDKVRTIYDVSIDRSGEELTFRYVGSGFLYQMVRVLTGTLIEIGKDRMNAEEIPEILEAKDRALAGPTIPGNGLYLSKVVYSEEELSKLLRR
ncbi:MULTISPECIES: tRNA pseudouridine(38-40) synthase TruA [Bacillaceae]|uniref:tRNA pseudouridine synthase A n=1 Tax=Evansella alkalicola TaxID=745819 RepID=A0ABS6JNQ1_9BACI|nr:MULTISPECIES: tRNA pseudouridine(38-40) synthase TruA [Bacillaceae]MBU9720191.1 tRNA pseudouridine(38-40) synthase TruA [Bacillus alkalicola]